MNVSATEDLNGEAAGLDVMAPLDILSLLSSGQQRAAAVVEKAHHAIAQASALAAKSIESGGKLIYAGAGSSGLMAMADALELPGTYGLLPEQVVILFAGGMRDLSGMPGGPEDDVDRAKADAEAVIKPGDCVIVLSASGSTPYALAVSEVAQSKKAHVVAIANNAGATLFTGADVAILLETPPEFVSGSTRMGAATAQKIALNMFSTLMAIQLGHVHDGYMVNFQADNKKLVERAARTVADITGVEKDEAGRLVEKASGSVKVAILLGAGARDKKSAEDLLQKSGQNVRRALELIGRSE